MAALGYTDGQRLQQLKEAESAYVDIFKRYQAEGNEVLTIANGLWVATSHIEQNFVDLLSKSYGAEVFKLQGNKNVTFEINEWVKNSTKGKIERIAGEKNWFQLTVETTFTNYKDGDCSCT